MGESIYYYDYRWPELEKLAEKNAIIILPVGQVEEHGPHLPVGCDTMISQETARLIAKKVNNEFPVLVLPPIWAGYSGKGLFKWPGTISIPPEIVIATIENIIVSLNKSDFKNFLIINSHGHHEGILRVAARKIADTCKVTLIVSNIWRMAEEAIQEIRESADGGANHAGEYETSLLLAMDKRVNMAEAKDEPVKQHSKYITGDIITRYKDKVFWSTWGHSSSQTGTYGCPTKATKEKGDIIMDATVKQYLNLLREVYYSQK